MPQILPFSVCKTTKLSDLHCSAKVLLDFSLTVNAATLIFISGRGSAISSAKEWESGFIYNLVKRSSAFWAAHTCVHFMKILTVYPLNSDLSTLKTHNHKTYVFGRPLTI